MSDFINAQPGVIEAACQSLLECRRKARQIEEFIESIQPLIDSSSPHAVELGNNIRESSAKLAHWLKTFYDRNAKEIFQAHP